MTYKKFKEHEKEIDKLYKDKDRRQNEYLAELKEKVSFKINELPDPQPADYVTFDQYDKLYDPKAKKSKKLSKLTSDGFWCGRKDTVR